VTVVQSSKRPIHRQLEIYDSARAEGERGAATLMHGPVTQNPAVGAQLIRVFGEIRGEVRRARFFFTFKHETQIHRGRDPRRAQGVERGEHRDDRSFVIAHRAREEPPLGIERLRLSPIDVATFRIAHHRLPWIAFPTRRIDRLTIVMRVERDRPVRIGHAQICDDDRRHALLG